VPCRSWSEGPASLAPVAALSTRRHLRVILVPCRRFGTLPTPRHPLARRVEISSGRLIHDGSSRRRIQVDPEGAGSGESAHDSACVPMKVRFDPSWHSSWVDNRARRAGPSARMPLRRQRSACRLRSADPTAWHRSCLGMVRGKAPCQPFQGDVADQPVRSCSRVEFGICNVERLECLPDRDRYARKRAHVAGSDDEYDVERAHGERSVGP